jgi:hypothetical protein
MAISYNAYESRRAHPDLLDEGVDDTFVWVHAQAFGFEWFREWDFAGARNQHYLQLWRPAA